MQKRRFFRAVVQTFRISKGSHQEGADLDPPVGGVQGVKTPAKSYYPEIFVRLFGHTLSGVSKDEKKLLLTGADLVDVPPGVKLDVSPYVTQRKFTDRVSEGRKLAPRPLSEEKG